MKKLKKGVIIILSIIFIILIVFIISKNNSKNNEQENRNTEINYNNETGEYYIEDENGEVLHSAYSEDDLYIYQIDPDYDAKNPDSMAEEKN